MLALGGLWRCVGSYIVKYQSSSCSCTFGYVYGLGVRRIGNDGKDLAL